MQLTSEQKQRIVDYFRRRGEVAGVYLYGSQAQGNAGPLSDADVAVLLASETAKGRYLDSQLEYINAIQLILESDLTADVKILNKDHALIYQSSVIGKGNLIVNNHPREVEAFSHRIGMLYPDFYPVLQNYYSRMYQRLEQGTYAT